jgi:hypothetical protein
MKVFIINQVVDLKEVIHIEKLAFNSRGCGFRIWMSDNTKIEFSEKIPYETYSHDLSRIFKSWEKVINDVTKEWGSVAEPINI